MGSGDKTTVARKALGALLSVVCCAVAIVGCGGDTAKGPEPDNYKPNTSLTPPAQDGVTPTQAPSTSGTTATKKIPKSK
jgi:hypothetical protein